MDGAEVATRKASSRSPILSLVDREYLKSTANIPRGIWEPMSYLYSEADKAVARVAVMSVPGCSGPNSCQPDTLDGQVQEMGTEDHAEGCFEWVRAKTLKNWTQVHGWLDEILLQSQSVDALRSWQLTNGLQGQQPGNARASVAIMPDFQQPIPPGTPAKPRNGMLRRAK